MSPSLNIQTGPAEQRVEIVNQSCSALVSYTNEHFPVIDNIDYSGKSD
jgi:hypothetical protein